MPTGATSIMQPNMSIMYRDQLTDVNAVQHGVTEELKQSQNKEAFTPEERCAGLLGMTRDFVHSVSE